MFCLRSVTYQENQKTAYVGPLLMTCTGLTDVDSSRGCETVGLKLQVVGVDGRAGAGVGIEDLRDLGVG